MDFRRAERCGLVRAYARRARKTSTREALGYRPKPRGSRFFAWGAANFFVGGGSVRSRFARVPSRSGVAEFLFSRRNSTIWSFYSRFDWGFDGWVGVSRQRGLNFLASPRLLWRNRGFRENILISRNTLTALKIFCIKNVKITF